MRILIREYYIDIRCLNSAGTLDAHIIHALWNLVLIAIGDKRARCWRSGGGLGSPYHCHDARTIPYTLLISEPLVLLKQIASSKPP